MIRAAVFLLSLISSMQSVLACDIPEGWLPMTPTADTKHTLWIRPDDEAYRQGQRFGADIMACADNKIILAEDVSIDAIMPAHRHGMNYLPELSPDEQTNLLRVSGLFFHMPGEWQITVTLDLSGKPERHSLTITVQ